MDKQELLSPGPLSTDGQQGKMSYQLVSLTVKISFPIHTHMLLHGERSAAALKIIVIMLSGHDREGVTSFSLTSKC